MFQHSPEFAVVSKTGDDDDGASIASSVAEWMPISKPAKPKNQITIAQAWKRREVHCEQRKSKARAKEWHLFVHSVLYCDICFDHGNSTISIGDEKYLTACRGTKWFDTEFILGFTSLLAHDAHVTPPPFENAANRVKMIQCPCPKQTIKDENVLTVPNMVRWFLLIAYNKYHFAVLQFDLQLRMVFVFDGLNYKLDNWKDHVIHTLRAYGRVPLSLAAKTTYKSESVPSEIGINSKQTLEIQFGDMAPWIVTNQLFTTQRDSHNCGPIACLKVMEVFGYIDKGQIDIISQLPGGYRNIVMDKFEELLSKYDRELVVETRMNVDEDGNIEKATATNRAPSSEIETVTATAE